MIRTYVLRNNGEKLLDVPIDEVKMEDVKWFWVDFYNSNEQEAHLLREFFDFHPLAVEDCIDEFSQRAKIDFYGTYFFLVFHSLHQDTLEPQEVDMFVNDKMIVTFHRNTVRNLNNVWERLHKNNEFLLKGPFAIMHAVVDKIVDDYFPSVYLIEEILNSIEDNRKDQSINELMEELFDVRTDLSKLRRTILPMRDLLYRILHSDRFNNFNEQQLYFQDVYDHLLKLVEMLESYRDFSTDIRDSYLSVNSNQMNTIMMTLTVITTIFMPLTFIAGVYGMNFSYMPELEFRYGYFIILTVMAVIGMTMFWLFQRKGWLRIGKKKNRKRRQIKIR